MIWREVDSTAVRALGYDPRQRRLGIQFLEKQQVYFYENVPPTDFEEFLQADSKGRYLTLTFLPRNYACTGPYPSRRPPPRTPAGSS